MTGRSSLDSRPFAAVRTAAVRWCVPERVPFGLLTLLAGDPGLGKSTLAAEFAARVTRGRHDTEPGTAILVGSEDGLGHTVRPRLVAADADLDRVHFLVSGNSRDVHHVTVPDDVAELQRIVTDTGARLVVIDPISAHLSGGANSWRDHDVRRALAPLSLMASSTGCAVVLVAHLNKTHVAQALYRVGGSVGWVGVARSGLMLLADPEAPERGRVLAHFKCNVGPLARSLRLGVQPVELDGGVQTTRLREVGTSPMSADELLADAREGNQSALEDAVMFLRAELADGPVAVRELAERAEGAGVSKKTLQRARGVVGAKSRRTGGIADAGHWCWSCLLTARH